MTNKMIRLLSALLCAVMLVGVLPAGTVFAKDAPVNRSHAMPEKTFTLERVPDDGISAQIDRDTHFALTDAAMYMYNAMKERREVIEFVYESSEPFSPEEVAYLIPEMALDGADYLRYQYGGWHLRYIPGENSCTYTYTMDYYTTAEQEKEVDSAVKQVLSELDVQNKSPYERVRAIYDYIAENVTYDYAHLNDPTYELQFTAYGALINKTAVCQGYAVLLYRMLRDSGIDNRVITGYANGDHAWNIIGLYGQYYNADVTWDAGESAYSYFLCSEDTFYNHYRDDEFATAAFYADYPMGSANFLDPTVYEEDGIRYLLTDGTATVLEGVDVAGDVVIPATVRGCRVTAINDFAFYGIMEITGITIPDGVTTIGESVFVDCVNLRYVDLPDSVISIGEMSFHMCISLTEVKLPKNLVELGVEAFGYCEKLEKIVLPDGFEMLGGGCFNSCTGLKQITIPIGVKKIGQYTFDGCTSLTDVYYAGTEEDRAQIDLYYGNEPLTDATWHYAGERALVAMYSVFNPDSQEHMFAMEGELAALEAAGWVTVGISFYSATEGIPVYRLFNPTNYSHYYCINEQERANLIAGGWLEDGILCFTQEGGIPIYDLFNPNTYLHYYTAMRDEIDHLVSEGWIEVGLAWFAANP